MRTFFTTERLCRAGIIAALYTVLTYAFAPLAFGPFQIRPAEALCILPLFFVEAIPALYVGCMLSNLSSPFALYDVPIGSLVTLIAAIGTYLVGKFFKKDVAKISLGGIFPVLFNALIIPIVIVFLTGGDEGYTSQAVAYFTFVASIFVTQTVCIYGLGTPLYFALKKYRPTEKRNYRK